MKKIPLNTKISLAFRTTSDRYKFLFELGIFTLADFLQYYPRDHERYNSVSGLHELRADEKNVLKGRFFSVRGENSKFGKSLTKAIFVDQNGEQVECVWFNQKGLSRRIPINSDVLISGKAKLAFGKVSIQSPDFELVSEEMVNLGRIAPIYREHAKLSSSWFRQKMFSLLDIAEDFIDVLPKEIIDFEGLLSKNQAIKAVHFPQNKDELKLAKKTLAFEELFILQLSGLMRKKAWQEETVGRSKKFSIDADLQKAFFKTLPFELTGAQKVALFEILRDFEKETPMLRLLEGDVGSGKTVVAIAATLPILKLGQQVAFMAPTEVLANQHFREIKNALERFIFFDNSQNTINIELLTGAVKGKKREEILEKIRKGLINVVVGTHALIQESVIWHDLGFVVIDEQHRFGVKQREYLTSIGAPHILQMTATPTPRTLAIVAFGDQDLSVINEMPKDRKLVHTKVVSPSERKQTEYFIENEVQKGKQGFVICPLVEGSDVIAAKAATEEFKRLKKDVFPKLKLLLLHGRMTSKEKKEKMESFKNKEFDILVSTSVVEVGVDVPNATFMLIEGAERFGLAQLHQFRGRVGRSDAQSYCFLFSSGGDSTKRLKALEQTNDGFRLAEIDLHLRGPGEVFGVRQSGIPDLKMASLFDARVISATRKAAEEFMEKYQNIDDFPASLKKEILRKSKIENN